MGSDSDLEIMKEAAKVLEDFGIEYEMTIISAHRTPRKMFDYAQSVSRRGVEVVISGAGGAAHAPGMIAALTTLPVIGVPILGKSVAGLDSLLSIVQMPSGIPVATVAINGAKNAGILAVQILGVKYPAIQEKMLQYKQKMEKQVQEKAKNLENFGYEKYLESKKIK